MLLWPGTIERYLDAPDEEAALKAVAEKVREHGHHVDSGSAEPIPPAHQDRRDAHARGVWAKTNNQQ
jgi:hypothetical protein